MEFCSLRENSIAKPPIKCSYIYQEKESGISVLHHDFVAGRLPVTITERTSVLMKLKDILY